MGDQGESIRVACAVIVEGGRILAARRGKGRHAGKWEFPGGKIEPGETPEEALVRELDEELGISVEIGLSLSVVRYRYREGEEVILYPYLVRLSGGGPVSLVHDLLRWVEPSNVDKLDWLAGDYPILEEVARVLA
ncbi:MAG: (deoxy)nucleoside triphosphate pyrophosphohydrolase [Leptospirillum sp.]